MKKILLYTTLAVAAFASCAKVETPQSPQEDGPKVYSLTVGLPEVKTTIDHTGDRYSIFWQNGDVISAGDKLSNPLEGVEATSSSVEFTFSQPVSDGDFVRYPGSATPSVLEIPAQQASVAGQYDPAAAPLWGTVEISSADVPAAKLNLNNAVAMLRFAVKGSAVLTKASLETLGGEAINGTFAFSQNGIISGGSNTGFRTDISFASPLQLSETATNLYIPVLPANYTKGFALQLYDDAGKMMKVSFFKDGQSLTAQNLAEFEMTYSGGRVEVLSPVAFLDAENTGFDNSAPAAAVKVGVYNVWATRSRTDDGVSEYRGLKYAETCRTETIVAMDCDIICFNELSDDSYKTSCTYSLENAIKKAGVTDYTYNLNNPNGLLGQITYANGFAYRSSVVKLETSGKYWLDSNNSTAFTTEDRTCVWGKFTQISTGKVFYVLVTHLDTASGGENLPDARYLITGISKRIQPEENATIIIAGDMNSSASHDDNRGFDYLTNNMPEPEDETETKEENPMPFVDARDYLAENGGLPYGEIGIIGTSVGSENKTSRLREDKYRYDHILFRNCEVSGYTTYRKTYTVAADPSKTEWYPSDHLPLSVYVVLP